jgi:hypothetical protein
MADGEVVPIEKARGDLTAEIGATGLRQSGGVIHEEFLRDLAGERLRSVVREMTDNDPVVGAMLFGIDMLIRQVVWRIEPAEGDPNGEETGQFVETCLHDMSTSWEDTLSSILSFLPHGWSYHEIVYKVRRGPDQKDSQFRSHYTDGKIGWRKLPIRGQDTLVRWIFDETGGLAGMEQSAPPTYSPVTIPIEKALLFRTSAQKANPEGRSILRNAYRPWFFKKRIEEIEGIGIERDLAGFPIAYVPARLMSDDASANDKAVLETIKKQVRNIKRDEEEGMVFPSVFDENGHQLYKFELLTTGGRRQFDTDATIARYNQSIAMTVLADFIMLGHEQVGSYALGSSKMEMFNLALGAWCDTICEVFNSYAIPRLMEMNGMDPTLAPKMTHDEIAAVDLSGIANYIDKLAGAAVLTPDPGLEAWARDQVGLPPVSEIASQEL